MRFDYSNPLDGENYIELGNTGAQPVQVTLQHTGKEIVKPSKGSKQKPKTITKTTTIKVGLGPYGYQRVKFSKWIKTSTEGVVTVVTSMPDVVIGTIVTHQYSGSLLNASKLFPLGDVFGADQYVFYDGTPASTMMVSNLHPTEATVNIECLRGGEVANVASYVIGGRSSIVHRLSSSCPSGMTGVVHVNSSLFGGIVADRVRAKSIKTFKTRMRAR